MLSLLVGLTVLTVHDSATTVPLTLLHGSRAAVQVMINGRGPYLFAIETGAPLVLISSKLADELALPVAADAPMVHSPNGSITMRRVDSLRIGATVLHAVNVASGPQLIDGVDGLLGLPAFRELLLTIDYPGRTVRLESGTLPEPNGRDIFPTVAIGPFFGVEIGIAGHSYPAVLDTQSGSALSVNPTIGEILPWDAPLAVTGMAAVGGRSPVIVRSGRLAGDVTLGSYTIKRPIINVHATPPGLPQETNIGSRFLMNFAVTLDQRSKRVRLTRADRTVPAAPPAYSIGLRTPRSTGGPLTAQIFSDSGAAYRAGIRDGDEILSIDGRPASEFSWPETLGNVVQTGRVIHFQLRRAGKTVAIDVTPEVVVR